MTDREWLCSLDNDDALFAGLVAALAEREVIPEKLVESARAAYSWRTIENDLKF